MALTWKEIAAVARASGGILGGLADAIETKNVGEGLEVGAEGAAEIAADLDVPGAAIAADLMPFFFDFINTHPEAIPKVTTDLEATIDSRFGPGDAPHLEKE